MFDAEEFSRTAGIHPSTLEVWIEEGWILPGRSRDGRGFSTIDLARAHFILDLRGAMGVNNEGVAVILHLVDQIHGLRRALEAAASTPAGQHASGAEKPVPGANESEPGGP